MIQTSILEQQIEELVISASKLQVLWVEVMKILVVMKTWEAAT